MNYLINNWNSSSLRCVSNERNFSDEGDFSYKIIKKNKKKIAFMKD